MKELEFLIECFYHSLDTNNEEKIIGAWNKCYSHQRTLRTLNIYYPWQKYERAKERYEEWKKNEQKR